jgi:hypothetical protein
LIKDIFASVAVLGADYLVRRGVMLIYMNRTQAEKYWKENIQFKEFQGNKKEMGIMDKKIKDVIANKVLIETDRKSLRWCNQYRVSKSNGDYQLVVDIKNEPIYETNSFQNGRTPTLEQLLMKNDFAISQNLKKVYNNILVHPTMQDLLGIQYQGRLYKYQGMLFGLNNAPRVFTQIMKKVIHAIREIWRLHCVMYLDDLLILH